MKMTRKKKIPNTKKSKIFGASKSKDFEGFRIEHNKKLFWWIIILLIALIVLIYFIVQGNKDKENVCVPATCCHPTECVLIDQRPDCSGIMCTEECRPDTLDCGQASCEFINGNCEVVEK